MDSLDKILFKSQPSPGEPFHVAIYLNDVVSSMQTEGALTSAFLAIRRGHHTSGHSSPTEHPLEKQSLEGRKNSFIAQQNEKFLQKRNPYSRFTETVGRPFLSNQPSNKDKIRCANPVRIFF